MTICMLKPFQETFENNAFRTFGDIFLYGNEPNSVYFQSVLVHSEFVFVSAEPIGFVNQNVIPRSLIAVFKHTLKLVSFVVCTRHSAVDVRV